MAKTTKREHLIVTLARCYKTFYGRKLVMFVISLNVCLLKPFQFSLMFACKARA